MNIRKKTLTMAQFSILLALEAIVCFTPLGSLPIGPMVATLSHIPVIIAALLLGTGAGTAMGFFFGLFSFIVWSVMPPNAATAFVFSPFYSLGQFSGNFWSIVICFLPRILIGMVAGSSFSIFQKIFGRFDKTEALSYTLSGILASMTNTVLVLLGIYLCFGEQYAAANNMTHALLLSAIGVTISTNGILEAVLGAVVSYGVCFPVKKILKY